MSRRRKPQIYEVEIEKLVHGGQGIGELADGRKAFVWNALPGEKVKFKTIKVKPSFVEGIAFEIIKKSPERVEPGEDFFLSTSPWQILRLEVENTYKNDILLETLDRAGVQLAQYNKISPIGSEWNYRNKMEYSFYGDEDGLHLALYNRGTHHKQIVNGSKLAMLAVDKTANEIIGILNRLKVRASELKTLILRCDQNGQTVATLFVKDKNFKVFNELKKIEGLSIYYSDPKSPASIPSERIYSHESIILQDELLGHSIKYNALSFFQVNIEAYVEVLKSIKAEVGQSFVTDMFSGVGSIGICVSENKAKLVEIDENSAAMAKLNIKNTGHEIMLSAAEKALDHVPIGKNQSLIVDPPRAGLHAKLLQKIIESCPHKIIYLSCNPSTLARDLARLTDSYSVKTVSGFNFFPKTPHIEALATLELK